MGHSIGAILGMITATLYSVDLLVAVAAPIKLNIPPAKFAREVSIFVKYWPRSRKKRKFIDDLQIASYRTSPLYATAAVFEISKVLRGRSSKLKTPVLYIKAGKDSKSFQNQHDEFVKYFPDTPKAIKIFENAPHSIFTSQEKEPVLDWIVEWFKSPIVE